MSNEIEYENGAVSEEITSPPPPLDPEKSGDNQVEETNGFGELPSESNVEDAVDPDEALKNQPSDLDNLERGSGYTDLDSLDTSKQPDKTPEEYNDNGDNDVDPFGDAEGFTDSESMFD